VPRAGSDGAIEPLANPPGDSDAIAADGGGAGGAGECSAGLKALVALGGGGAKPLPTNGESEVGPAEYIPPLFACWTGICDEVIMGGAADAAVCSYETVRVRREPSGCIVTVDTGAGNGGGTWLAGSPKLIVIVTGPAAAPAKCGAGAGVGGGAAKPPPAAGDAFDIVNSLTPIKRAPGGRGGIAGSHMAASREGIMPPGDSDGIDRCVAWAG
jgi:hypothetical protein